MAWVRCFYEEDYDEPTGMLYLETQSKRVEFDGLTLKVGRREIKSNKYFEEHLKQTGTGYGGGSTDIHFLEIDGFVLIDNMHQEDK